MNRPIPCKPAAVAAAVLALCCMATPARAQTSALAADWQRWLASDASVALRKAADAQWRSTLQLDATLSNRAQQKVPFRVAGFGDSYAAGEGNPAAPGVFDFFGQFEVSRDRWHTADGDASPVPSLACHQSSQNGLMKAVRRLRDDPVIGKRMEIQVHDFSCSGSELADLYRNCRPAVDVREKRAGAGGMPDLALPLPQIDLFNRFRHASLLAKRGEPVPIDLDWQPLRDRFAQALVNNPIRGPIDAVTLSIGGNDSGFGQAVAGCALSDCVPARDAAGRPVLPGNPAYRAPTAGLTNQALKDTLAVMRTGLAAAVSIWKPESTALVVPGAFLAEAVALDLANTEANKAVAEAHQRIASMAELPNRLDESRCRASGALDCKYFMLERSLQESVFGAEPLGRLPVDAVLPYPPFHCPSRAPHDTGAQTPHDAKWHEMFDRPSGPAPRVHIAQYPNPLQRADRSACTPRGRPNRPDFLLDGIDTAEARFLTDTFIDGLNAAVVRTARLGWSVVGGAAQAMPGHSLCDAEPWVLDNTHALSAVGARIADMHLCSDALALAENNLPGDLFPGGAKAGCAMPVGGGTAHPNEAGYDNIGRALFESLREQALEKLRLDESDRPGRIRLEPAAGPTGWLRLSWDAVSPRADGYVATLQPVVRRTDGAIDRPLDGRTERARFHDVVRDNALVRDTGAQAFDVAVGACFQTALGAELARSCPDAARSPVRRIGAGVPAAPVVQGVRAGVAVVASEPRVTLAADDLHATASTVLTIPLRAAGESAADAQARYAKQLAPILARLPAGDAMAALLAAGARLVTVETRNDERSVQVGIPDAVFGIGATVLVAARQCSYTACGPWSIPFEEVVTMR